MPRTTDDVRHRLSTEPDYIYLPRCNYSLERLVRRYPDGVPLHLIAQGLLMTEEEVEEMYEGIVVKLRTLMLADP